MGIRRWESRRTHQGWGTGYENPTLMILISLIINVISLIVAVVCTLTVIRDLEENYGGGIGWPLTIPAPAAGILWALIDSVVCHYFVLNVVYYLVESTLLMTINVVLGAMIFIGNSWSPIGAAPIIPGIFLVLTSLSYMAFLAVSARLHHMQNMQKKRSQISDAA